jgi:hypothetical protein
VKGSASKLAAKDGHSHIEAIKIAYLSLTENETLYKYEKIKSTNLLDGQELLRWYWGRKWSSSGYLQNT